MANASEATMFAKVSCERGAVVDTDAAARMFDSAQLRP